MGPCAAKYSPCRQERNHRVIFQPVMRWSVRISYRRTLISGQSARLVCGYVYANAGEGESTQDLVFGGQNMIAENGAILAEGKRFENGIIYSEIDVQRLD